MVNSDAPGDDGLAYSLSDGLDESWWTPERIALLKWLGAHAPALAPLYQGALLIAMRESFPGRVHFIAHAIREIQNRLPSALGPKVKQHRTGYEDLTDKILQRWIEEGLPEDGSVPIPKAFSPSDSRPECREVSVRFLRSVGRLVSKHITAKKNRTDRDLSAFGALTERDQSPRYVIRNWKKLFRDAQKYAHARDEPLPTGADTEWVQNFLRFEKHLFAVQRPSYANLDELDLLLEKANKR